MKFEIQFEWNWLDLIMLEWKWLNLSKFEYVRMNLTRFDYVIWNMSEIWLCYIEIEWNLLMLHWIGLKFELFWLCY
jgi:hypothetical protein